MHGPHKREGGSYKNQPFFLAGRIKEVFEKPKCNPWNRSAVLLSWQRGSGGEKASVCWPTSLVQRLDVPRYFQGACRSHPDKTGLDLSSLVLLPPGPQPLPPLILMKAPDLGKGWSRAFLPPKPVFKHINVRSPRKGLLACIFFVIDWKPSQAPNCIKRVLHPPLHQWWGPGLALHVWDVWSLTWECKEDLSSDWLYWWSCYKILTWELTFSS